MNGDHVPPGDPPVAALADAVDVGTEGRDVEATSSDDWTSWWAGVAADPDLGPALAAMGRAGPALDGDHRTDERQHVELLRSAGFASAGTVWRSGPSAVLVACTSTVTGGR